MSPNGSSWLRRPGEVGLGVHGLLPPWIRCLSSGNTSQEMLALRQYDDFGKLTKSIDPKRNGNKFVYDDEIDPDGDGGASDTPLDGRG